MIAPPIRDRLQELACLLTRKAPLSREKRTAPSTSTAREASGRMSREFSGLTGSRLSPSSTVTLVQIQPAKISRFSRPTPAQSRPGNARMRKWSLASLIATPTVPPSQRILPPSVMGALSFLEFHGAFLAAEMGDRLAHGLPVLCGQTRGPRRGRSPLVRRGQQGSLPVHPHKEFA